MKIFISWSGTQSRAIAEALNDWLPRVIQALRPFYSPEIEKGAKWSNEVDDALEGTHFGIICLTPENLKSPWVNYEAGALSKTKDTLIWTFLYGLVPSNVPPPLGKFQHTVAQKNDVLLLLKTINRRLADAGGEPLQERLLEDTYGIFWPKLEEKLKETEGKSHFTKPEDYQNSMINVRDERAILDEILELVRSQERRLPAFEKSGSQITFDFDQYIPTYREAMETFKKFYMRSLFLKSKGRNMRELAEYSGMSPATFYKLLKEYEKEIVSETANDEGDQGEAT